MNTILILTAKSRAAEVMRDKKTLKRARAMNNGAKHFENAGSTAARLIGGTPEWKSFAEGKSFRKRPDGTWLVKALTPAQINREMEAARKHDLKQP